jgi:hypothetical protein
MRSDSISFFTASTTSSTVMLAMHPAFIWHLGVMPNLEQGEQGRFFETTIW